MKAPPNWHGRACFTVLDTAFGIGQRFLSTWSTWAADPAKCSRLHYVAISPEPPSAEEILSSTNDPHLARELLNHWWGLVPGVHRLRLASGRVALTLAIGDMHAMLKSLVFEANWVNLSSMVDDPASVSLDLLKAIARHCQPGTVISGLSSAPRLTQQLQSLGFQIDESTGERLASFSPNWPIKRHIAKACAPGKAIVIGAGLSGAAVAHELAVHGWQVQVFDRANAPASAASALPVGLMATHVSPDDAPISRASRAGCRATLHALSGHCIEGHDWQRTGALEQGRETTKNSWPARWDRNQTSDWFHRDAEGLHHRNATWIKPGALVRAWLDHAKIGFYGGVEVNSIEQTPMGWAAKDRVGETLADAPLLVVCTAYGIRHLLPAGLDLPLDLVAGQVAMGRQASTLRTPLNGNGHLVLDVPGDIQHGEANRFWLSGSTYERMPLEELDIAKGLADNRERLARLLSHWPLESAVFQAQFANAEVDRWIGERCTSIDRLPIVGEWLPGLHVCAAQGSRGLCFSALCAELLVAHISAEPLPIDARLAQGFAARRFQPVH